MTRRGLLPMKRGYSPLPMSRNRPKGSHLGCSCRPDRSAQRGICGLLRGLRLYLCLLQQEGFGAEEGTRTPTPLRVHGPEPCASANSATPARDNPARERLDRQQLLVYKSIARCQTALVADRHPHRDCFQLRQMVQIVAGYGLDHLAQGHRAALGVRDGFRHRLRG